MFSRHCRSLEVIKRSFGGHFVAPNLNLTSTIESVSQKKLLKRHITCPKGDLVKELCFQVTKGHLRSFQGYLDVIW